MSSLTHSAVADGVATITLDDGKVNALSFDMIAALLAELDRAEADASVTAVVLTGRATTLSAGFDLRTEPERFPALVGEGARLAERLLAFPRPVVIACNGNAIAMGAFLLLAGDHRIGAAGDAKIGLNETAIGLTLPWFGIELARQRLTPPAFHRCTVTGVLLDPDEAAAAGFLDETVAPGQLADAASAAAKALAGLNAAAFTATKLRVRAQALAGVREGLGRLTGTGSEW